MCVYILIIEHMSEYSSLTECEEWTSCVGSRTAMSQVDL